MSDAGGFDRAEECADQSQAPVRVKRKRRAHRKEFVGWGSRELIEFLESVGRETDRVIPQHDVVRIITSYVNDNGLINPAKKKRIICDYRLLSLFGKKSIGKNKIYDLLGAHYAENNKDSGSDEDDNLLWGSDDYDAPEKQVSRVSEGMPKPKRRVVERPESCFANIVPENLKLVYLRRSLIGDLMKNLDGFEEKLVGCFVRTKSDPNDFLQKNPFLISEVTGVKMASRGAEADAEVLFQVAGLIKDVPLPKLSDDNFTEEECTDLRRRVNEGLIKRPTVVGLEAKARLLHEDITRNWLSRELAKLDTLIDRANEKGWRKELSEYLDRRKLLRSPDEQSRLLTEMPKVIADDLERDPSTAEDDIRGDGGGTDGSPTVVLGQSLGTTKPAGSSEANALPVKPSSKNFTEFWFPVLLEEPKEQPEIDRNRQVLGVQANFNSAPASFAHTKVHINPPGENLRNEDTRQVEEGKSLKHINNENSNNGLKPPTIDLTGKEDDEIEIERPRGNTRQIDHNLLSMGWHYLDPQGYVQGPFTLELLQIWSNAGYFPKDFKVWMTGQHPSNAVKLTEILFRQMFLK
ncbi:hypothetical protein MLD38_009369 [Melastoma candidum]|uniref:Uncharacterized protein n=1 Tax=Melastoma candidum TaxID=119954 RepID=A0ACB9RYR7_9MYRT|nr:hypothetical protein MLD38_009369 [Melastoma candidum]